MQWLQDLLKNGAKDTFARTLDAAHEKLKAECGMQPGYGLKPSVAVLAAEAFLTEFVEADGRVLLAELPAPGGPVLVTVSGYDDQAFVMHATGLLLDRRRLPAPLLASFLRRSVGPVRWQLMPSQGRDDPTVSATLPAAGLTAGALRAAGFAVAREAAELRAELRLAGLLAD